MKQLNKICAWFFILTSIGAAGYAQSPPPQTPDSLGLPGDNLNLYAVLSLFKDSKSVEEFEQKLNSPDNKVNNLDLNHDGQIDYLRVKDYGENGLHSLVIQDPITATESQDVAIIEIEQQGNNNVHVQIVGDEDLYGKNYIVEPQDQQQAEQAQQAPPQQQAQPVYNDQQQPVVVNNNYYDQGPPPPAINVWGWPSIQFMYGPSYTYWNSPFYWGYYPGWWSPWRPMGYHGYWNGMYAYRGYHRRVYVNRFVAVQGLYYGHRQSSPIVHGYITNHVYYGPRMAPAPGGRPGGGPRGGGRVAGNGGRTANGGGRVAGSAPRANTAPRNEGGGRQAAPTNNAPRQQQSAPKQQAPRQEAPKQAAPHNNGGGGHSGGGGSHGGGGGGKRR